MKHIVFTLTLALALLITGQLSAQQESPAGNINNTLSIIENGQDQPNMIPGSALPGLFETTSTHTRSTDNRNNPPEVEWQASFGDNNDKNWGYCVSQTSDGGYIMVGAADFDTTGDYNAWLIKTDALGNMLWSKEFGDYFIDEAYVVKETSNGGYIIAGMSTQFGWSGEGWLIRTDASGNVIWNKGYHPAQGGSQSQWDYIYDVWETADGGFITVGQAGQNVNLIQGWIMKVNSSGNRIWENTFGCQYWDRLFSVYPTPDGAYIAAGDRHFSYNGGTTYKHDGWLVKFNTNGDTLWTRNYGSKDHDIFRNVMTNEAGEIIIVGQREPTEFGGYEAWIVKTDADGNPIWNNIYGKGAMMDLVMDYGGNYLVAGTTVKPTSAYDAWMMRVNPDGTLMGESFISTTNMDEIPQSFGHTADGGYVLGGRTAANSLLGKFWMVKFEPEGNAQPLTSFYEDFDAIAQPALPEGWSGLLDVMLTNTAAEVKTVEHGVAPTQPNAVFIMNGLDGSNGQIDPTAFVALVSPLVEVGNAGAVLNFHTQGTNPVVVGMLSDPEDASTFTEIQTVNPTSDFSEFEIQITNPATGHIAFKNGNVSAVTPVFIDAVTFEAGAPVTPLTEFYQDFDAVSQPALPEGWSGHLEVLLSNTVAEIKTVEHGVAPTQPNAVFVMNGLDGSNGQLDPTAFVALVSPLVEVGNNGSVLSFHAQGGNPIVIGMMTDPEDASTFTEIQTVNPTADFSAFEIQINTPGTGYIAFKNGNVAAVTPVFIDAVTFEADSPVTPVTEFYQDFDGVSQPALPEGWTGHLDVLLSNTVAEIKTAEHGMAPTQPNAVFIMNGLDGSNGQLDPTAFVALVSPLVDITEEGATLTFQAQGGNPIIVGTMTDPEDAETFVAVQEIIPAGDFAEYTAEFTAPFTGHIAFRHGNTTTANPVFVDAVNFEAGLPVVPLTAFYEDFDNAIQPNLPSDWSEVIDVLLTNTIAEVITLGHGEAPTQPYAVFVMNGLDGSNGQLDPTAFVGLVSPLVEITSEGASLSFWAQGSDPIIVGTMTDPGDLSTFIAVDEVTPSMIFTEYTVEFTEPAVTYIVFKHSNQSAAYPFFVDAVTLEPGLPVQPVTAFYEDFDGVAQPELPQGWNGLLDVLLTNTVAEIKSVEHAMAPTQPNAVFVMNGLDGSNGQIDPTAFAALVSPPVTVTDEGATLSFQATGSNPVVVGWLTDPQDASTFTEIQTVSPTSDFEVYTVEITTPGTGYIALKNGNVSAVTPVFLDEVVLEPGLPVVPILPPTDLTAQAGTGEVLLNWSAPQPAGEWLHFDSGENIDGIGLEEGGTFMAAARWPMDWINPYDGQVIEAVRIFPRSNNNASFTLKIWKGGNASTLLYEQALDNLEQHTWNTIELDNPVVIDGSQWLWAGYEVSGQAAGDYPAGVDAGPAVGGYGDMVFMNGMWSPLSSYDLDYNWNIQILVADNSMEWQPTEGRRVKMIAGNNPSTLAEGKLPPAAHPSIPATDLLQGYNIYRDGVQINESVVEQTSYTDATVISGDYFYYVTALYSEGESDASNTVEVYVEGNNGQLNGFIRDAVTNLAITTATLTAFGTDNGVFTKTTPFGSHYSMMVPAGTYDVTCTAEGYEPQTAAGLEVIEDANTHYTFYLEPLTDQGGKSSVIRSDETQVYPNPSNGAVTISGTDIQEVVIRNGNGQKVYQGEATGEKISVAGLKSGLYLIRIIKNSGEEIHEKLIVR